MSRDEVPAEVRALATTYAAKFISKDDNDFAELHGLFCAAIRAALASRPAAPAPAPQAVEEVTAAARDVLAERERQKTVEGWTPDHDDQHVDGQMAKAAGFYAAPRHPAFWPWAWSWFKPTNRRRDLVKAGALIFAEIERLDRAADRQRARAGQDGDA